MPLFPFLFWLGGFPVSNIDKKRKQTSWYQLILTQKSHRKPHNMERRSKEKSRIPFIQSKAHSPCSSGPKPHFVRPRSHDGHHGSQCPRRHAPNPPGSGGARSSLVASPRFRGARAWVGPHGLGRRNVVAQPGAVV